MREHIIGDRVNAIKPDTEDEPDGKWLKINADFARIWPNITV